MKNLKLWLQENFTGGENVTNPANLLKDNEVQRLLNLLPGSSGEPLYVRGGFQEWNLPYTFNNIVSINRYKAHVIKTGSETTVYLMDAFLVTEKDGTTYKTYAVTPDGYELPLIANVNDESQWSASGSTPAADPGKDDEPPPVVLPVGASTPASIVDKLTLTPPLNASVPVGKDTWTDEAGNLELDVPGLNNVSKWVSITAAGDTLCFWKMKLSDSVHADQYWDDNLFSVGSSILYPGDVWEKNYTVFSLDGTDLLCSRINHQYDHDATVHVHPDDADYTNPKYHSSSIVFPLSLVEANRTVNFYFKHDANHSGAGVRIYYRKVGASGVSWSDLLPNKTVHLVTQSGIPVAERFPESSGLITVATTIPLANVEVKIEFVPSLHSSARDSVDGQSGYWCGYDVE